MRERDLFWTRRFDKMEALVRTSYDNIMLAASYGYERVRSVHPGEYPPPLDKRPRRSSRSRSRSPRVRDLGSRSGTAEPHQRSPSPRRRRTASTGEEQEADRPSTSKAGSSNSDARLSDCSFCGTKTCKGPTECALSLPFYERMYRADKTNVCPDRLCVKRHAGKCRQPKIKCAFCAGVHHRIYCEAYARKTNNI